MTNEQLGLVIKLIVSRLESIHSNLMTNLPDDCCVLKPDFTGNHVATYPVLYELADYLDQLESYAENMTEKDKNQ